MNHIHYLSDKKTICEKPSRLGHDFVVVGTQFGISCHICSDLLFEHNLREYEKETREVFIHRTEPSKKSSIDKDNVVLLVLLLATVLYLGYLTKGYGFFA